MKIINSYYNLGEAFYKKQIPDKIKNPELLIFNQELARELNLGIDYNSPDLSNIFAGNKLLYNSKPISLAYAGHQFGYFIPRLGDGRAILLGEIKDKNNELFDIQLKGSGRTFFSRNGDGKCPLDAAIREYIVSEAMYFLQIPTTRSLAIVKSSELIQRDNLTPASVITRVAKSHIRVGTFEYFASRGDIKNLKILADYTIKRHFPKYHHQCNKYLHLLRSVIKVQIELVTSWMSIGFIHGVMNTDNISICGQTLDYGPCAFMDEYESNKVFSFIDKNGRYSFGNQRNILLWNITKFAETILHFINSDIKKAIKIVEEELSQFLSIFDDVYYTKMANKLGISCVASKERDRTLVIDYLKILEKDKVDFTNGFRNLSKKLFQWTGDKGKNNTEYYWHKKWMQRLLEQKIDFKKITSNMNKVNPILIPRNHIVANIIKESVHNQDYRILKEFLEAIRSPVIEKKEYEKYYIPVKGDERIVNTFCGT